jgi:hypothetical protein
MIRDLVRHSTRRKPMIKKLSRLQLTDITATRKRLGQRELSDAQLKLVGGGVICQGGTCTTCDDCDE